MMLYKAPVTRQPSRWDGDNRNLSFVHAGRKNILHVNKDGLTFVSIGVTHVVGGPIRVIMGVGSGPIHSYEFAPVHLKIDISFEMVAVTYIKTPA